MKWSSAKRNATPAQFRKMLRKGTRDSVRIAEYAGRRMAKHLLDSNLAHLNNGLFSVRNLSKLQIERFRRMHNVPRNRVNVMLAVACSRLEHPKPKAVRAPKETLQVLGGPAKKFWRGKKSSPASRTAGYRSYVAKARKSLNLYLSRACVRVASPMPSPAPFRRSTITVTQSGCIQPVCKPYRRLPRVTLIKFTNCGEQIPLGGSVFCEHHSPRRGA